MFVFASPHVPKLFHPFLDFKMSFADILRAGDPVARVLEPHTVDKPFPLCSCYFAPSRGRAPSARGSPGGCPPSV